MELPDLVDRWVDLDKQIKDLIKQKEAIMKAIGPQAPGTELQGRTRKIRVRDRAVLKGDRLELRVTPAMWRRITKRVPVADLLKAEVKRGKIDPDTVTECQDRSEAWFETIM